MQDKLPWFAGSIWQRKDLCDASPTGNFAVSPALVAADALSQPSNGIVAMPRPLFTIFVGGACQGKHQQHLCQLRQPSSWLRKIAKGIFAMQRLLIYPPYHP